MTVSLGRRLRKIDEAIARLRGLVHRYLDDDMMMWMISHAVVRLQKRKIRLIPNAEKFIDGLYMFELGRWSEDRVLEDFLGIPKSYRRVVLGHVKNYFIVDHPKFAPLMKKLRKAVSIDSLEDLYQPTPYQALKILRRIKEEMGLSWMEIRERYLGDAGS